VWACDLIFILAPVHLPASVSPTVVRYAQALRAPVKESVDISDGTDEFANNFLIAIVVVNKMSSFSHLVSVKRLFHTESLALSMHFICLAQ